MKNEENQSLGFRQKWKNFSAKTTNGFIKIGSKVGSNKMLAAIRDAFAVSSVPLLGAAFPVIIGLVFFQNDVLFGKIPGIKDSAYIMWTDKYIAQWFWSIWSVATAPFTLYFVIAIGYFVSKAYLKNGSALTGAIVAVACFFGLFPLGPGFNEGPTYLGTSGILLGVVAGILAPFIFAKLMAIKKLRLKLPDSVPPVIAEVFASIVSITIVLSAFTLVGKSWTWIEDSAKIMNGALHVDTLFKAIEYGLAEPFKKLGVSVGTTAVIVFFIGFFWFFGLHGSNILAPITGILWTPIMYDNANYWQAYINNGNKGDYWTLPLNIGTGATGEGPTKIQHGLYPLFNQMMAYVGGTGATLGLLIAIFLFSKYRPYREISKLGIGPGIFGINEPVTFGIPMIFNLSYFIPYVFGFTFIAIISHLFIIWHWVRPVVVPLGWTPFILQNLLMTGFDYRSIIFDTFNLLIAFGMWSLFLPIGEKVQKSIDAKELGITMEEYTVKLAEEEKNIRIERRNEILEKLETKNPQKVSVLRSKWDNQEIKKAEKIRLKTEKKISKKNN